MKNDDGSKQKIIQTVRQMIEKDVDINKITVRAIAAQGIFLHYDSIKEAFV